MGDVHVLIDHREHHSLLKEFQKSGLSYEVKSLLVGDILLQTHVNGQEEIVCIERKSQNDFINSFFDKRIFSQLLQMKKHYSLPLLIVEGEENLYQLRNIHPNVIRGMLTSIALDFQVPLIYSRNYRDTVKIVKTISDRLSKSRKPLTLHASRKSLTLSEKQLYVMESFPGVGPTLARSLLRYFKTIKSFVAVQEKTLQKVEKIGPKKARVIKEVLEEEFKE